MTVNPTSFSTADVSDAIGVRQAEFLRRELGQHACKKLMAHFGIAQSTAEKILAGKRAENRLFDRLILAYGRRFFDYAYQDVLPEPVRRIEEEIYALRAIEDRLLARLEEERNAMAVRSAGPLARESLAEVDGRGGSGHGARHQASQAR